MPSAPASHTRLRQATDHAGEGAEDAVGNRPIPWAISRSAAGPHQSPINASGEKIVTSTMSWGSSSRRTSSTVRTYSAARPVVTAGPNRRNWATCDQEDRERSSKRSGMSGMILAADSRCRR